MRIDAYNKINQLYNTNKVKSKVESKEAMRSDKLEISQTGQDIQVAKNAVKEAPEIRKSKVDFIKKQMETGSYDVSMQEVADKLVDSYFDKKI